jgi:hypothetical protein
MEAIKSIEVQNLNSNIVIPKIFLKAPIIAIDLKKLWIFQTTNQIPYHTLEKKIEAWCEWQWEEGQKII